MTNSLASCLALAISTASAPLAWTYATENYSRAVAVSSDGRYVIAGGSDGYVYMISASGQETDKQKLKGAVSALSISGSTRDLIAGSTSGHVLHCLITDRLQMLSSLETHPPADHVGSSFR